MTMVGNSLTRRAFADARIGSKRSYAGRDAFVTFAGGCGNNTHLECVLVGLRESTPPESKCQMLRGSNVRIDVEKFAPPLWRTSFGRAGQYYRHTLREIPAGFRSNAESSQFFGNTPIRHALVGLAA